MSELETATDDEITANDETSEDLSEGNAAVLLSIAKLELILTDGEWLISELETTTDDVIIVVNDSSKDLSESNAAVL